MDVDLEELITIPRNYDVPNTINGLTFSEMRAVLRRVSGDWISDWEQARGCDADARRGGEFRCSLVLPFLP